MDDYIQISKINDFVFCPYSVYLHSVYEDFDQKLYHRTPQTVGKIKHEPVENKTYTTSAHILQAIEVSSEKYGILGKIDTFNLKTGELVERKTKIKKIFDGYKFQLYAQMFSLQEMGYKVKSLALQSLLDNKHYVIILPNQKETEKFKKIIKRMHIYKPKIPNRKNTKKCEQCIYRELCH